MQIYGEESDKETMRTEFYVDYNLYDLTALDDAQESSGSNSDFADLSLIKQNISAPNYGTLEHNFFVLDGSMEEFPDEPDNLVYFSKSQSGENGVFTDEQSISVQFTESHTSVGLTLTFLDTYPVELEIRWFDIDGKLMDNRTFYPESLVCFCEHQVEEYYGVKITFKKTLPWHNVKLQYIKYGTSVTWNNSTIKSGKLVTDVDPISNKISTDKLTFEFVDKHDDFNLGNPSGLHKTFQRKQNMEAYEMVDGEKINLGTFFLDSSSTTKNICKMAAVDYKGMLSNVDFADGRMYNGEAAGNVIAEIMETAGIADYEVDEETAAIPLYGTLKIQTCQKALREVLFACGSIISTSGRTGVSIYKANKESDIKIERGKKFSTTFENDRYVSDINVKYSTWTLEEKTSEITKGIYGVGTHIIQLSSPAANMTTNAGTIIKQMPYYIILEIGTDVRSEVVISGQKYIKEELSALASIEHIKSGELRNTKTFSGTLLNFESASRVAKDILDYYQLQQIIKTKHLVSGEKSGDWVEIENPTRKHGNFVAAIESETIDLTGGFIATTKCRGYYKLLTDYYLTGEIYTGEDVGIL